MLGAISHIDLASEISSSNSHSLENSAPRSPNGARPTSHLLTKNCTLALASDARAKEARVFESIADPIVKIKKVEKLATVIKERQAGATTAMGGGARGKCRVLCRCDPQPNLAS